ncbi:MAG TPA: hypothetical protein VIH17_01930 [Candidatus Acidoferrales bacterium]
MATAALFFVALAFGQQLSRQPNPRDYPAHDAHEGVAMAADPYLERARAERVFGSYAPHKAGVLAVEMIVKNETGQGMTVNWAAAQLLARSAGWQLRALTMEELTRRLVGETKTRETVPSRWPPLPRSKKAAQYEKARAALAPHFFEAGTIPPGATARGFLFFDIGGDFQAVSRARIYIPEVKNLSTGQPLMFFEMEFR